MTAMASTVLVVDDHPSFRATARRLLQAEGFEVVGEAENGAEAVRKAGELQPRRDGLRRPDPGLRGARVHREGRAFGREHSRPASLSARAFGFTLAIAV